MRDQLHDDELPVTLELVGLLIESQFPDYAGLPPTPLHASGSSNRLFRLGDELLVRLPRQPGGSASIDKERRWNPLMARHLPVAIPEIIAAGQPAHGYPEQWSIVRWLEGKLPTAHTPESVPAPEQ